MNKRLQRLFTWLIFMALMAPLMAFAAECPQGGRAKVDNFVIFQDYSGSMAMTHEKVGQVKIKMAKDALLQMSDTIPELGYNSSFATFAPYSLVMPAKKYDKASLKAAVQPLKTDYEIFDRQTPMGRGLQNLDQVLSGYKGSTAIIMLSDGAHNLGPDPVAVAKDIYNKYKGTCIHVISYADTAEGKKYLDQIAALNPCTVYVEGAKLKDPKEMQNFVNQVFVGAAEAPKAVIDGPDSVMTGQSVSFSAAKSADPLKGALTYSWKTCEGKTGSGQTFDTTFTRDGSCEVTLTVTNQANCTDTARKTVKVGVGEERIVLRGINFDFDKSNIKPEFVPVLDQSVAILKQSPNMSIVVEGHTDSVGTDQYNQGLSERRAKSVRDYFVKQGIDPKRITTVGYGESKPKYDNNTAEGRYLNRRVELQVKR